MDEEKETVDETTSEADPTPGLDERLQAMEDRWQEAERNRGLLQSQIAERDQELANLRAEVSAARAPEPDPREAIGDPTTADAIDKLIEQRIKTSLRETLEPFVRSAQASTQVDLTVPGFAENKLEIMRFMSEHPEVQQRYSNMTASDPIGAAEYALLKQREAAALRSEAGMHEEDRKASAEKSAARRDSRVPHGKNARETTREMTAKEEQELMKELVEHGQQTRDYGPYLRERMKGVKINFSPGFDDEPA